MEPFAGLGRCGDHAVALFPVGLILINNTELSIHHIVVVEVVLKMAAALIVKIDVVRPNKEK